MADPWSLLNAQTDVRMDVEWLWRRVGLADENIAADLVPRDLHPIAPDEGARGNFVGAAAHIASLPTLEAALASLIDSVTLLEAAPDYDVSHSEPRWPGRIFVSSPPSGAHSALRLLENVVHEGMHLQLTLFEATRPLVAPEAGRLFSPWKAEDRDAQGVLHGAYVFTCIDALFAKPQLLERLTVDELAYAGRRRIEIAAELRDVDLHILGDGLTDDGRRFLKQLMQPADADVYCLTPVTHA